MESLSVGGLVSGLDTNAIIDGLVQLERAKVLREEKKQSQQEAKLTAFNDLSTMLAGFAGQAKELNKQTSFNLFSSESSDDDIATIGGNENAIPGTYELTTHSLATTEKVTSKAMASMTSSLNTTGTFTLNKSIAAIKSDPLETTVSIEVTATDSLKDIANKINAADGSGVKASIMQLSSNDYRLVLSSVDEGSAGMTLGETAGDVLSNAATGLGILSPDQAIRSDLGFRLAAGGAANATATLDTLFAGIGRTIANGDSIEIAGTDGLGNAVNFTYNVADAGTESLQNLLTDIQTQFTAGGANATVGLNASGEIVITSADANPLALSLSVKSGAETLLEGTGQSKTNYSNTLSEGRNAFFTLNGLSASSQSNKAENLVVGTIFNLHKADPTTSVKLSLAHDKDAIQEKIQGLVNKFNEILGFIDTKSKVSLEEGEDGKQKVSSKGPFAGDSSIQRIKTQLRGILTSAIPELSGVTNYTSLSSVGITSSIQDGTLSIDAEKFKKALDQDMDGVRRLFITSGYSSTNSSFQLGNYTKDTKTGSYSVDSDTDRIDSERGSAVIDMHDAQRIGDILTSNTGDSKGMSLTAAAGSGTHEYTFVRGIASQLDLFYQEMNDRFDGFLTQTREGIQSKIDSAQERVGRLEETVERFRQQLIKQFSALEQNMARLQQQSSAFQSQISGLGRR